MLGVKVIHGVVVFVTRRVNMDGKCECDEYCNYNMMKTWRFANCDSICCAGVFKMSKINIIKKDQTRGGVEWARDEGDQAGAGVSKWQERISKATAKVGTIYDPSFPPLLSAEATCGSHDKSTCLGKVWWMVLLTEWRASPLRDRYLFFALR